MKTILFADNDSDFLDTRAEFLERAGYAVLKACSLGLARQLLADAHVHLSVVDIRMVDDDDDKDVSGLTLAKEPAFRPVPKIILTAFPTYEAVREALGPLLDGLPAAVGFLAKQEGPEALIRAAESAFIRHVRINWDLVIRWHERDPLSFPHLVSLILPEVPSERLPDRVKELEDLFRKLFCDKHQITIGQLLWRQNGRICLPVFAYSPEGIQEQRLVICGTRPAIEQEVARYKKYAPKGGRSTALVDIPAETVHFAALAYDLHGADLEQVQTFEAFYKENKTAQVREAVRRFFETTLTAWHQEARALEEAKSLGQMYRERMGLIRDKVALAEFQRKAEALVRDVFALGPVAIRPSAQELILEFPNGNTVSYPNPILYLYDEANEARPVICRITPGTLRKDNILIDQEGRTWLTDFAQAGPAPLLWDFVSLEAILRFDLVDATDLLALHDLEKRLVSLTRLNDRLDVQDIGPPLRKALEIIREVRNLAFSTAGGDIALYQQGLFFHAMSGVAGYVPGLRHNKRELARVVHALLAAAMICKDIKRVFEEPAQDQARFSLTSEGIRIDAANRRVWVEGKQVELSQTEFDLLSYLYTHAGQLCRRRAIVEEGLRETYVGDDQEAARLNTMITRLRKKIEPDPDNPSYIKTVRRGSAGQEGGYVLNIAKSPSR